MSIKKVVIAAGILAGATFGGHAAAQDAPTITVDPSNVDAAGSVEFTVEGSGFTVASLFLVPCELPESGDPAMADPATCDSANLTPVAVTDGAFTATVTYDVPEEGLVIAAADATQTETAAAAVTVGAAAADDAAAEGGDDAAAEEGDDAATDDAAADDLASTGADVDTLAYVAVGFLAAGLLAFGASRRTRTS